jgi:hypothetical protein
MGKKCRFAWRNVDLSAKRNNWPVAWLILTDGPQRLCGNAAADPRESANSSTAWWRHYKALSCGYTRPFDGPQWIEEDFKPISVSIEKPFRKKGWVRDQEPRLPRRRSESGPGPGGKTVSEPSSSMATKSAVSLANNTSSSEPESIMGSYRQKLGFAITVQVGVTGPRQS